MEPFVTDGYDQQVPTGNVYTAWFVCSDDAMFIESMLTTHNQYRYKKNLGDQWEGFIVVVTVRYYSSCNILNTGLHTQIVNCGYLKENGSDMKKLVTENE